MTSAEYDRLMMQMAEEVVNEERGLDNGKDKSFFQMKSGTGNHQGHYLDRVGYLPLLLILLILLFNSPLSVDSLVADNDLSTKISDHTTLDHFHDGYANLKEGIRLFQLKLYDEASAYLWKAVLLQERTHHESENQYSVNEAFIPFLECYSLQNRLVDGLVFISAESFARGQIQMGNSYLSEALKRDAKHHYARKLKQLIRVEGKVDEDDDFSVTENLQLKIEQIIAIRDSVGASVSKEDRRKINKSSAVRTDDTRNNDFWNQFYSVDDRLSHTNQVFDHLADKSPEEIYNIATHYFNAKNLTYASKLFELSCQKSNAKLSPSCTNAIYLRTNLCDWGEAGRGFENDMKVIQEITEMETGLFRSTVQASTALKRENGMNENNHVDNVIQWRRATSVHPHMMLGYPLDNKHSILKRYVAESMASLDEIRSRLNEDGSITDRPQDLPYSLEKMQKNFKHKNDEREFDFYNKNRVNNALPLPPIKVGFVGSGFNSKAVLYLSHDMFRFFDPSIVEIHVFSTGSPDHPQFISRTMRGVDWRQRVIDNVDYFHDVRRYQGNHIGLARYIHERKIQILIEWDGYARQGERAAGLMALRPCPVQILHQEFLMTSGAQYIDYIITDKIVSPLRLEHLYTEKFIHLPNHFFSKGHAVQKEIIPPSLDYVPKTKGAGFILGVGSPQENSCLSSNPLGDNSNEQVSFVYCNFNKFLKHNPETVRSWMRILQEVPNSILCLLENPVEGISNLRMFIQGLSTSSSNHKTSNDLILSNLNNRVHFLPWEKNPFDHQLRTYSLCNVMLDSHPYNGHTTAQDSLYAGVPIVTRSDGNDMSSRVSTSANIVLGLEVLNAYNGSTEYEDIAIRLGNDKDWFSHIRTTLVRTCLQKNPMHPYWDVPRYVKNFEKGLILAWNNFLRNTVSHIDVVEENEEMIGTFDLEMYAKESNRKNMIKVLNNQTYINEEL